jgi:hypothetical protein
LQVFLVKGQVWKKFVVAIWQSLEYENNSFEAKTTTATKTASKKNWQFCKFGQGEKVSCRKNTFSFDVSDHRGFEKMTQLRSGHPIEISRIK